MMTRDLWLRALCSAVFLLAATVTQGTSASLNPLRLTVEHSLDEISQDFQPRGEVLLDTQSRNGGGFDSIAVGGPVTLHGEDLKHFKELASRNGLYRVRFRSSPSAPYVLSSIRACDLVAGRLKEDFSFHVGDEGNLMAVEYRSGAGHVSLEQCREMLKAIKDWTFSTNGAVVTASEGFKVPELGSVKQKPPSGIKPVRALNTEGQAGETGEEEQQSFLRKYWYVILPLAVMLLFGGGPEPEGQQRAGAGGASAPARGQGRR